MNNADGFLITQERINSYAEAVRDFNPIHVDPEFAATTPYGRTIAHGTISASLMLRQVIRQLREDRPLLDLTVRYIAPSRVGDRLICEATLADDEAVPGIVAYDLRCLRDDATVVTVGRARFADRQAGR